MNAWSIKTYFPEPRAEVKLPGELFTELVRALRWKTGVEQLSETEELYRFSYDRPVNTKGF